MGAFDSGFGMGMRAYDSAVARKRQAEQDSRQRVMDARADEEYTRRQGLQRGEDRAFQDYQDLQSSGQAVGRNTSGFSDGSARMLSADGGQQAVDDAASFANVESRRFGLPLANTTSLGATPEAALSPTVQMRKSTEVDQLRGLEKIAVARRDPAAMASIGAQRRGAETTQLFADAVKEYTGAPEQIGPTIEHMNGNSGRVTMGAPDKRGFVSLSVTDDDNRNATFLKLNRAEQAKLYAAGKLMEVDPVQGLAMIESVNKKLADAVDKENGITAKLATNANDVANKRGGLDIQKQNADTNEAYRRQIAAAATARASGAGRGGAGGAGGKPMKMQVESVDPVTGKKVKVDVRYDPATNTAVTADGKPFNDSAALDRVLGRQGEEAQIGNWAQGEQRRIDELISKGVIPYDNRDVEMAKIQTSAVAKLMATKFRSLDAQGQQAELVDQLSQNVSPEVLVGTFGASPQQVKEALAIAKKQPGGGTTLPRDIPASRTMPPEPAGSPAAVLDDAKARLKEFRSKAPGLKVGVDAREQYRDQLTALQNEVKQAERSYQENLGPVGPFIGFNRR